MTRRVGWRWFAACALVAATAGCAAVRDAAPAAPVATTSAAPNSADQDPARFAAQVVARAREAGVDPQLVMAILYNESYKPHDPAAERAWLQLDPDAALGVANMHRVAFDEVKADRDFAGRDWLELPDDPDLAIRAAAWYLHDLAAMLPDQRSGAHSTAELLALGYNAGPGNMRAFAKGSPPGPQAQSYLDRLRENWQRAGEAVAGR
ncbi:transglycosylase SLT domain-containing protein [Saccharopolyspora hirsuta]|uniref:Lytic transglycosylase domain-containing protein n=1 Tax=Saccharopolyspora hirsuta TaxID=1837 RepID=A0A5M7BLA0_SACHI|nr:transglycosylase SLT domain-containing protein [Saccharopolyspora hirsuta]KAA5830549.1 lytic transglycosylase domain-containing protein [Saccharopolyspora hirsuta]